MHACVCVTLNASKIKKKCLSFLVLFPEHPFTGVACQVGGVSTTNVIWYLKTLASVVGAATGSRQTPGIRELCKQSPNGSLGLHPGSQGQ